VSELERDVHVWRLTADRQMATERQITRDLVEAVHVRMDRFETEMLVELRQLRSMLSALVGNGSHG
jgi:hypothetical protein